VLLLALFLVAGSYLLIRWWAVLVSGYSYQWLIIGMFVLTTGASVSIGRSAFGVDQAMASRYISFSLLFLPSLVVIILISRNLITQGKSAEIRARSLVALSFIAGAGAALFLVSSLSGWADAKSYGNERLRAGLAVEFATVIPDNPQLNLSLPNGVDVIPTLCRELSPFHLPHLTAVGERISKAVETPASSGDGRNGFLDRVLELGDGQLVVSGWAILTARTPADGVLVVWRGDSGVVKPIAVLPVSERRPDVGKALRTNRVLWSGFDSVISKVDIPGAGSLTAWAIDNTHADAYPLAGAVRIRGK